MLMLCLCPISFESHAHTHTRTNTKDARIYELQMITAYNAIYVLAR